MLGAGHIPGDDLLSQDLSSHYHRRCSVSLPGSEWDRVVPPRSGHQRATLSGKLSLACSGLGLWVSKLQLEFVFLRELRRLSFVVNFFASGRWVETRAAPWHPHGDCNFSSLNSLQEPHKAYTILGVLQHHLVYPNSNTESSQSDY